MATQASIDAVQKAYIAYYGRPADTTGLNYWADRLDADGGSFDALIDAFGTSAEATALFGGQSATATVAALYQQILGRSADLDGLNYYAGKLTSGEFSAASIAQRIYDGATGDDATLLTNKLAVAKAFTAGLDTVSEVLAYSGDAAAASVRTMLATVTATTDAATFDTATTIAALETATVANGETFTLTTGIDTVAGTANNDTIKATGATLEATDTIDGGAGTDTLVIVDTTSASEAQIPSATISNVEALSITANGGVGAEATTGTPAVTGTAEVQKFDVVATGVTNGSTVSFQVGGITLTTGAITIGGTAATDNAAVATAMAAALNAAFPGTVASASSAVLTVTAPYLGDLATVSSTLLTATAAGQVAHVEKVTTIAQKQVVQFVASGTGDASNVNSYYVDGQLVGQVAVDTSSSATTTNAASIKATLATILGDAATVTVVGSTVTVTAATAGTPLPFINVVSGGANTTTTITEVTANSEAAIAGATAVQYDATDFANTVTVAAEKDVNIKVADTAAATISTDGGSVRFEGGLTANITATDEVIVSGNKLTDVTVKTGTASGDTVTIGATSGTTADTPVLETATVTGGTTIVVTDKKGGTSAKTLTTVSLNEIAGTATLTGDAIATVNWGKQTTAQTVDVVNASTTVTTLALNLADTGVDADGASATVKAIVDAKTLNIGSNGTSNDLDIESNSSSLTAVNVSGAGDLAIELDASTTAVAAFDASAATGDVTVVGLEAVAVSVKTGAGDDTFTTTATAALTVDAGAGDDTVTLGSAVAKGSTVSLGAGDDTLLSSSGSVATDDASTVTNAKFTTIDGGEGTDTVAASLFTAGNADQFVNFEVLGLDITSGTLDTDLLSGLTSLKLLDHGATYTNLELSQSVAINADTGAATDSTTLTFTAAEVAGTADSYSIDMTTKGATASTAAAPTTINGGVLVVEGVENVAVNSGQTSGYVNNQLTLTSANMKTVALTGSADTFTLAFAGTNGTNSATAGVGGAVSSIDTSAFTGDVVVSTANVTADTSTGGGLTVTTGAGKDDITIAQKATVNAGAEDDAITVAVGAGNSVITGGAGDDAIDVSAVVYDSTAAGRDSFSELIVTIADFTAGDTIDFSAGSEDAETALGTAVSTAAATSLDGALTAILVGAGTAGNHIAWGTYLGNTYLVHNADKGSGTDTGLEAGDVIVKLAGVVDLSDAAFSTGGVLSLA